MNVHDTCCECMVFIERSSLKLTMNKTELTSSTRILGDRELITSTGIAVLTIPTEPRNATPGPRRNQRNHIGANIGPHLMNVIEQAILIIRIPRLPCQMVQRREHARRSDVGGVPAHVLVKARQTQLGVDSRIGVRRVRLGDGEIHQVFDRSVCVVLRVGLGALGVDHEDVDGVRDYEGAVISVGGGCLVGLAAEGASIGMFPGGASSFGGCSSSGYSDELGSLTSPSRLTW